jgi:hypothetical protein
LCQGENKGNGKLEDLPLETIARVIVSITPDQYIARYEALRK